MTFDYIFFVLVLGLRLVSGLPSEIVGPDKNVYNGRDGTGGGSSCTPLTLVQAEKLPGWAKIVQYANDTYGDDGLTYVFNPADYPNNPATVCVGQQPITISLQSTPSCSQSSSAIEGTITGTTGAVTLSYSQGYSNTASWSVIQESALAQDISLTATFELPEIVSISGEVGTTTSFSNSLSQGFTTTFNNQITETVTVNTVPGETCSGTLSTTTCTVSGTGTVQYVASGWVWFYYATKRAPKSDPKGGQHYRWAVTIGSVLDTDESSSSMTFTGVMEINNKANFSDSCS